MRRRLIVMVVAAFVLATTSQAGPIDWIKTHKRFLLMEGAAVTGAVVQREGIKHCRLGDVERCPEGYGETWAWYWIVTSWSVVVSPSIAEACWRSTDDAKGCYFFAYSGSAYQTSAGIYDWRNYKPKEERDMCHDLKCEARRFR